MKKLSIVIPVYNMEKYLERCLKSILLFPMENVEVILVNDGSTDGSGVLCDFYGQENSWTVIHKQNGGLSDARNVGMKAASGEYIWFIDSDDYISNSYHQIIDTIENLEPDIIVMNYEVINNEKVFVKAHRHLIEKNIYEGTDFLLIVLKNKEYFVPTWTNIYSRHYLISNNFSFRIGVYHEDEQLAPYLFLQATKIVYLNIAPYKYVIRENSIAHSKKWKKNLVDTCNIFGENAEYFRNVVLSNELRNLLLCDMVEKLIYIACSYKIPNAKLNNYIGLLFLKNNASNFKTKIRVYVFLYARSLYDLLFKLNAGMK